MSGKRSGRKTKKAMRLMARLPLSIKNDIKTNVALLKCPVHYESAKITFRGQEIDVICCCDDFKKITEKKCPNIISNAIYKDATKRIKRALR